VLQSPKGNSREPSIQHRIDNDLYTYIKYIAMEDPKTDANGYLEPIKGVVAEGQNVKLTETIDFKIDSIVDAGPMPESLPQDIVAKRVFVTLKENIAEEKMILVMASKNGVGQIFPSESKQFGLLLGLVERDGQLELQAQQHKSHKKDLLILSAEIFPWINLLWLGCFIMVIGTTVAIYNRIKEQQRKNN
jgi:cytochrome c-type biogenesis protein CcmF